MYLPMQVEVKSLGEDVELVIGTWRRRMFFETALLLASWMDECSRSAKYWAGVSRRRIYAVGTLHDASAQDWINEGQPNDPCRMFNVNRDLLKKEQISVRNEGALVVLSAGAAEAAIPHAAAIQIAQWIRVRAKESQLRAGDSEHWGRVKRAHEQQHGPGVTRG